MMKLLVRGVAVLMGLMLLLISSGLTLARSTQAAPQLLLINRQADLTATADRITAGMTGSVFGRIPSSRNAEQFEGWSKDGKWLYFSRAAPHNPAVSTPYRFELWQVSVMGTHRRQVDIYDYPIPVPPVNPAPPPIILSMGPTTILPPQNTIVWTPDGEWVLYPQVNAATGKVDLMRRRFDGNQVLNLTKGQVDYVYYDSSNRLQFSPDSHWVYFSGAGSLGVEHVYRAALDGSVVQDLTPTVPHPIWLDYVLPDGEWLLLRPPYGSAQVARWRMRVDGTELQEFASPPSEPSYFIAWLPKSQLMIFFDQGEQATRAVRWTTGETVWSYAHSLYITHSPDETWIMMTAQPDQYGSTFWERLRPDGTDHTAITEWNYNTYAWEWSKDGLVLLYGQEAYVDGNQRGQVRRIRLDGTADVVGQFDYMPSFEGVSRDGEWLFFSVSSHGHHQVFRIRRDGSDWEPLFRSKDWVYASIEGVGPFLGKGGQPWVSLAGGLAFVMVLVGWLVNQWRTTP